MKCVCLKLPGSVLRYVAVHKQRCLRDQPLPDPRPSSAPRLAGECWGGARGGQVCCLRVLPGSSLCSHLLRLPCGPSRASRLSPVVTGHTPREPCALVEDTIKAPGGHWGHSAVGELGLTQPLREKTEPPVLTIVGFLLFLLLHLCLLSLTIFCSSWPHN